MAPFNCKAHVYISNQKRGKREETRKGKIQKRIEENMSKRKKNLQKGRI